MLRCNIDRTGRRVRAVGGVILMILGGLSAWHMETTAIRWGSAIILCGTGLFCLFEAAKGWCVLRALGIKTPI